MAPQQQNGLDGAELAEQLVAVALQLLQRRDGRAHGARLDQRARALKTRLIELERQIDVQRVASQQAAVAAAEQERASALLALVGVVNVPIIYFSVKWWNTLHQGASVSMTAAPKMAQTMLVTMLIMAFAAWFYTIAVALHRVRSIILEREAHTDWVRALVQRSPQ